MRIGGLTPISTLDYPQHICAVVFTCGCNLRCDYCHNRLLLDEQSDTFLTEEEVLNFLRKRSSVLKHVTITGGEPTLQEDLPRFCHAIKSLGYKIKLDTNGSDPLLLKYLGDHRLIDYVAMDLKTDPDNYRHPLLRGPEMAARIRACMAYLSERPVPFEFRTTAVDDLITTPRLAKMLELVSFIFGAELENLTWYFQVARPVEGMRSRPLDQHELMALLRHFDIQGKVKIR